MKRKERLSLLAVRNLAAGTNPRHIPGPASRMDCEEIITELAQRYVRLLDKVNAMKYR